MQGQRWHDHRRRRTTGGRWSQTGGNLRFVFGGRPSSAGEGRQGRSVSCVTYFAIRLGLGWAARGPICLFPRGRRYARRDNCVRRGNGYRVFFSFCAGWDQAGNRVPTATCQWVLDRSLGRSGSRYFGPFRPILFFYFKFTRRTVCRGGGTRRASRQDRLGSSRARGIHLGRHFQQ